jgi:hypothetical protein
LNALEHRDPHAVSRLLPLVYEALRKLAAQRPILLQDQHCKLRYRNIWLEPRSDSGTSP